MTRTIALLSGLAMVAIATTPAQASPNGKWKRPSTGAIIQVDNCGGGLGMKVVSSSDAAAVGQRIMCGAKQEGANKWRGRIKSTEDGNTYLGIVTLRGSTLQLEGCVLGGIICRTENWSRQ